MKDRLVVRCVTGKPAPFARFIAIGRAYWLFVILVVPLPVAYTAISNCSRRWHHCGDAAFRGPIQPGRMLENQPSMTCL